MIPSFTKPLVAAMRKPPALRYYQTDMCSQVLEQWEQGVKNILLVLPTGGGKTVCMGYICSQLREAICLQAHRQELVGQISCALARFGILHRVIAPESVIKQIQRQHIERFGSHFINPNSPVGVAGVDTLIRKGKLVNMRWAASVTTVFVDEGHHCLKKNKWGRGIDIFTHPDRKILLPSATPERADGHGLGDHASGYAQIMIIGPSARQLIDEVYLVDFKVAMPETDVEIAEDMFSASGELNQKGKAAVRGSHIVGNVVEAYLKFSPGKPAVVFATEVQVSVEMAEQFRKAGVRAMHVDGDTDPEVREDAIRKLERGELEVLTNVDLFGEGFDLPNIYAVYDCAATESFARFVQRFGRMLRLDVGALQDIWETLTIEQRRAAVANSPKPYGLYVDLVGNVNRHKGTPDRPRAYSLDDRSSRPRAGGAAMTTVCANLNVDGMGIACSKTYARFKSKCPYCGHVPEPAKRDTPEAVDGNIVLLDAAALRELYAKVIDLTAPFYTPSGVSSTIAQVIVTNHRDKVDAQKNLRDAFAWWAGERRAGGLSDQEIDKLFYLTYGLDRLTAFGLGRGDADELTNKLDATLTASSVLRRIKPLSYIY